MTTTSTHQWQQKPSKCKETPIIRNHDEIVIKHILDSLSAQQVIKDLAENCANAAAANK
ncbi:MAG: hypothetical protein J6Y36_02410 [Treponema sp.]|nr:hypothetical protein [Treponema sp.]